MGFRYDEMTNSIQRHDFWYPVICAYYRITNLYILFVILATNTPVPGELKCQEARIVASF